MVKSSRYNSSLPRLVCRNRLFFHTVPRPLEDITHSQSFQNKYIAYCQLPSTLRRAVRELRFHTDQIREQIFIYWWKIGKLLRKYFQSYNRCDTGADPIGFMAEYLGCSRDDLICAVILATLAERRSALSGIMFHKDLDRTRNRFFGTVCSWDEVKPYLRQQLQELVSSEGKSEVKKDGN